jgi:NAD-dependent deacetylase
VRTSSVDEVADVLAGGGAVAFTGSGISAESGIPTFRDPGGIWERFDPSEFGTWDGLLALAMTRPDALADFLAELRRTFAAAVPGAAHAALARLEAGGILDAVVTQNVDGLHQAAGSRRVVELHGSFARTVCLLCGGRDDVGREAFLAGLDRAVVGLRSAFVPSLASLLPRCWRCDGPARPDFVAFGEPVEDLEEAGELVRECRVLLVVGTSGEVYPAAALPEEARRGGATVVDVSVGPTDVASDLRLRGKAGSVLPAVADRVLGPAR